MKTLSRIVLTSLIYFAGVQILHAQAIPTAQKRSSLQFGVGWGFASPDYGRSKIQGLTIYGDYDLTRHWSIEGNIHLNHIVTPDAIGEDTYVIGPRYVFHLNRFQPYAKFLGGFGRFKTTSAFTYGVYALGGGIDFRATSHINIRAVDFEYQRWPGFRDSGLTPMVYTFGAAYRF